MRSLIQYSLVDAVRELPDTDSIEMMPTQNRWEPCVPDEIIIATVMMYGPFTIVGIFRLRERGGRRKERPVGREQKTRQNKGTRGLDSGTHAVPQSRPTPKTLLDGICSSDSLEYYECTGKYTR